jgi:hypothetical protein
MASATVRSYAARRACFPLTPSAQTPTGHDYGAPEGCCVFAGRATHVIRAFARRAERLHHEIVASGRPNGRMPVRREKRFPINQPALPGSSVGSAFGNETELHRGGVNRDTDGLRLGMDGPAGLEIKGFIHV